VASSNVGKLAEFRDLLGEAGYEFVTQGELGVTDAEETGLTFVENALLKARHAARITGLPALADDSGLCVDALGGAPGLYSARYAGSHGDAQANIAKLLDAMKDVPRAQRTAHFIAVIVLLRHAEDFGYDPVFLDPENNLSGAEFDPAIKNRLSHRGRALAMLRQKLADTAL
jgi:XTP/dITP diphosphohydrolase